MSFNCPVFGILFGWICSFGLFSVSFVSTKIGLDTKIIVFAISFMGMLYFTSKYFDGEWMRK